MMWRNIRWILVVLLIGVASNARLAAQGPVLNGIDVLEADHFSPLKEMAAKHGGHLRLALMTNQTGLDNKGRRTLDVLVSDATREVPGLTVVNLFSPEHGISGVLDEQGIGNGRDQATNLQVISLYGATDAARRPTKQQLGNLDAVVIDLQDVGVHYYTYETVVGYFLEAASGTKTEVVVLDRPNPINGVDVQGIVSSPGRDNYINYTSEPVRHGMTMGELATYFKAKNHLDAQLTSSACADGPATTGLMQPDSYGSTRHQIYAVCVKPSSILGSACWNELTLASVAEPIRLLNARNIPGIRFIPVQFIPGQKYPFNGELCHGIEFLITDRTVLDSPELGLEVASALYKLFPGTFQIDKVDSLLLNQSAVDALKAGEDPRTATKKGQGDLDRFKQARTAALLYK